MSQAPTFIDQAVLDDAAVDAFARAMKSKLADARANGRGGWHDRDACPQERLSDMLRAHVEKGDPRDVANFCMFLHQRGECILPCEVDRRAAEPIYYCTHCLLPNHSGEDHPECVSAARLNAKLAAIRKDPSRG